jgi:cyclase
MAARIIPVLLLDRDRRLVKTVRFGERTYIGDPFNVVRLFNEKEVDEILVLDIDASVDGRVPDVGFCRELAAECFMPLGYGGGITSAAHCEALNRAGIEKFVLNTAATDLELVGRLAGDFGTQAIVAALDVRGSGAEARCCVRSARTRLESDPVEFARRLEAAGAGEIVVQSVERDGLRGGYDLDLVSRVSAAVGVPVVALGGAGTYEHLSAALAAGASAAASGSAFCFIGRLRAVLVNYPSAAQRERLSLAKSGAAA